MNPRYKSIRYTALLLSFFCLFAFVGCQKQSTQPNAPTGENSDVSSVVVSSFPSSQAPESEATPSMEESPASSQETPSPSSQAEQPASQPVASESSQPEMPTIPFTIGEGSIFWKNPDPAQASNVKIVIIRSMAELRNLFEQENGYDAPESYEKYDDAFFEEYTIVFIGQQFGSGSYRTRVNHLTRSGNRLIVDYSTLLPPKSATAITNVVIWQKLLEVSKADLEGVTEIVPQYHEIQLTENEDYDESAWKQ